MWKRLLNLKKCTHFMKMKNTLNIHNSALSTSPGTLYIQISWNPVCTNLLEPCMYKSPGTLYVQISWNPLCTNLLEPCMYKSPGTLYVQIFNKFLLFFVITKGTFSPSFQTPGCNPYRLSYFHPYLFVVLNKRSVILYQ